MQILFVSNKGDGCWFVWKLIKAGHSVDWVCASEKDVDTMKGIIPAPLAKVPSPSKYDLVVFDSSGLGEAADEARESTLVIGGASYADELEHDRIFGLTVMEDAGIKVPRWESFNSPAEALSFLKSNNKRYVLKPVGEAPSDMTYVAKNRDDMVHFIEVRLTGVKDFVLQEFVDGVEVSTEAWWTGSEWCALNHTLEEKKFMNDGKGPNTGCAGNVVWMPLRKNPIFEQGLEKMGDILRETGYVGMVDLNTIATESDLWGLEWTPRFGYEGTCNLVCLLPIDWAEFMSRVANGETPVVGAATAKFAATIRLSVPPYPSAEFSKKRVKVPIQGIDPKKLDKFVLYDAVMEDGEMMTTGTYNAIGCPIGLSETIGGAFEDAESAIKGVDVPNLQYRTDLKKCVEGRYAQLQNWGWLRSIG